MVDILPFRAIRYSEAVGDLAQVVAPPYDVIKDKRRDALYAAHENNVVRVDLNRPEDGDEELSRYERSAAILNDWLEQGVLHQDDEAAYYVLAQTFTGPDGVQRTRTGFFGRARLTPFGDGPILPHERTLKGPKLDRLRLYRATKTNLSPIFGMVQDPDGEILKLLASVCGDAPTAELEFEDVKNQLWAVRDKKAVQSIQDALAPKNLYIADGHHRYETGIAYRDERRAEASEPNPEAGYESILMFTAAVEDPGMVVFPTHRLVHSLDNFDEAKVVEALSRFFKISDHPADDVGKLMDTLANSDAKNAFAMVTKSGVRILETKKDAPFGEVDVLPKHKDVRELDVTVLHAVILEHVLNISREAQASQANLRYSKDNQEALSSPQTEEAVQIAFMMNPTKIREVIDISDAGEVMPQKSTFFFPKIPSGLVLYPLD